MQRSSFIICSGFKKEKQMKKYIVVGLALLTVQFIANPALVLAGETVDEQSTTVDQVLERYIEALGGRDAIEKLTTRVCTGQVTTDLRSREIPILEIHMFEAYTKIPRSFLSVTYTDAGIERMGFDGEVGWIKDKCDIRQHEWVGRDKLAWLLNPQNALRIKEYFPGLSLSGTERIGGGRVYVVIPHERSKAHYAFHFDVETGLLVRIGYYWDLQDYRKVDGVLFPHRIETSRKGGSTTYEFREIRHNVPVKDSIFAMPNALGGPR
jgi:hypothetical protein